MRWPVQTGPDRTKYPTRYPECDPAYERAQAARWLALEARLNEHPFCLRTLRAGRHGHCPVCAAVCGVDAAWWQAQPWLRLQVLAGAVASQQLAFASVMEKYPVWVTAKGLLFPPA